MSDVGTFELRGEIGVITIDSPPVNALGLNVRLALDQGFRRFSADPAAKAIVLICGGRTFFAGADISEFGKPPAGPDLHAVFDLIETGAKPVIAAIHGTALGGGLELALICHYRVGVPSAKFGLPEVNLGLLPGAGGTQRLPRIVGVELALDLMTSGRPIGAREALAAGVIDAMAEEGKLLETALNFAEKILAEGKPLLRVRDRQEKMQAAREKPEIFAAFRQANAAKFRGFKAPENIIKAVEAAVGLPFEDGMKREAELFGELITSTESAAQRYIFFAEREAAKIPDVPAETPTRPLKSVGIVGAGTMGGGIAMNFLNAGLPVTIVEANQAALDRGIGVIRGNYETSAKRGKLKPADVDARMALLTPSLQYDALQNADLIIEAVFESLDVKREVFGKLDQVARPGAILASNTSFLDLDAIAAATARPDSVIGLHFFSPANVMRLLEVVRGTNTSKEVIATAMKLAKQIGKQAVLARVCDGFIANRIMRVRGVQADAMILEGTSFEAIDQAVYDYGFAAGPFKMMDIVGLDVIGRGGNQKTVMSELVARDRLGQKKNGGYYDYDADRRATPSAVAAAVIAEVSRARGIAPDPTLGAEDIIARLLYPVVNEGARILEEGIAIRASDIDIACIAGYNWPVYTGGPMFWAGTVGLPKIVAKLQALEARFGAAFKVSPLLEKLAAEGKTFTRA
jgi:3-hydroxyacyl-CoA dehydrogenase